MLIDPWLPVGFGLPGGTRFGTALWEGPGWQIADAGGSQQVLIADVATAQRWIETRLIDAGAFQSFSFGSRPLVSLMSGNRQMLCQVADSRSPNTKSEAIAFALALRATRAIDPHAGLQDAIYVERLSRLLPSHGISSRSSDEVVLGYWLTGGVPISVTSTRRMHQMLSWLSPADLADIVTAAGLDDVRDTPLSRPNLVGRPEGPVPTVQAPAQQFELPGRPDLQAFFNEHVVDIVNNRERYKSFGIGSPSAIVLHGPPGCGKTFAVERLVDFLGWPSFTIEASSVASPYIHETSRKVAQVFDNASAAAPSVLIIDEMDAFLADRDTASGQHRVEEVAEFLRRIPAATADGVLVIAMTNRLDMIDQAVLRRGRFDHILSVGPAGADEIRALLQKLLNEIPAEPDIDLHVLAGALAGRPLSDVAFSIREGARLAIKAGRERLDQNCLEMALRSTTARGQRDETAKRIGFI